MKRNILSLLALCVLSIPVFSQILRQPVSAVYLGLASYSTQHTDVFSFTHNQASLASSKSVSAGIYGEQRFLINTLNVYTSAVVIPTDKGNFGIDLNYSGFKDYNENEIGFAYARNVGKKADIGIQFNHYQYHISGYGNNNAIDVEIGAIAHLTEQLNLGIHIYNPVGGNFSKSNEKLTTKFTAGLGYDASEIFFVAAEVVKEESFPPQINAGIQYQFQKQFFARMGIASGTSSSYFGAGVAWSNFRIDVSVSFHPQLGISPGLLFIVNFKRKKNE